MVKTGRLGNQMGALNQTAPKGVRFKTVNPRDWRLGKYGNMVEW